ncbi:response regulator [bacterium]|nr:response regulator [bacterium]
MSDRKKRILIVDDEEDLTWSLSRKLKRDKSDLEVFCANTGTGALQFLADNSVDLVLTDLRMPGLSGLQLLNEIRAKYPLINVIVMTAYGSAEVREAIDRWGDTEYIEKPFEIQELRSMVFKLLNNTNSHIEVGNRHDDIS